MLNLGEAIWESENFHFLLPSGRHSGTFVRPAHAIRTIRDARVAALWLLEYLYANGTGVVVDSHTLTSMLLALQVELKARGADLGPVRVLEGYPATAIDTLNAVQLVTEQYSSVLGLVSVSGTGTVRDHLVRAMRDLMPHQIEHASVVTIFDISHGPVVVSPVRISALIHLDNDRQPRRFESHDGPCRLCEDARTAPLVPIDIDTFDVRFPSFVKRETPSIADPQRNRDLWEACDRQAALLFDADPDQPVSIWRSTGKMTWKVDWNRLIMDDQFGIRTRVRLEEEIKQWNKDEQKRGGSLDDWRGFDLVLVPEHDSERPGFTELWKKIGAILSSESPCPFPEHGEWNDLGERIERARKILVLSLGTVTGTTLQRALNEVQRRRTNANYSLFGVVLHARPAHRRTWQGLRNSYAFRLIAAYLSYLPDNDSPLRDESHSLQGVDVSHLSPAAQIFLSQRQSICKGEIHDRKYGFLWGARPDERITPHSLFGHVLSASATLIAVGSAIHARRESLRRPPYRITFEMPTIARSYYDPVIFACMLRWLRPPEIWWGNTLVEGEGVVGEVLQRASSEQRPLLLGELLLASAQGKLRSRGREKVIAEAQVLFNAPGCPDEVRGLLELGLHLVETHPGPSVLAPVPTESNEEE